MNDRGTGPHTPYWARRIVRKDTTENCYTPSKTIIYVKRMFLLVLFSYFSPYSVFIELWTMNCRFLTTERLIVRSFMKKPQQTPINFLKSTHSSLSRSISYRSGGRPPFLKSFAFQNIIKPGIFTFAGIGGISLNWCIICDWLLIIYLFIV